MVENDQYALLFNPPYNVSRLKDFIDHQGVNCENYYQKQRERVVHICLPQTRSHQKVLRILENIRLKLVLIQKSLFMNENISLLVE